MDECLLRAGFRQVGWRCRAGFLLGDCQYLGGSYPVVSRVVCQCSGAERLGVEPPKVDLVGYSVVIQNSAGWCSVFGRILAELWAERRPAELSQVALTAESLSSGAIPSWAENLVEYWVGCWA